MVSGDEPRKACELDSKEKHLKVLVKLLKVMVAVRQNEVNESFC